MDVWFGTPTAWRKSTVVHRHDRDRRSGPGCVCTWLAISKTICVSAVVTDTAVHLTDYAAGIINSPIQAKQATFLSVIDVIDRASMPITHQTRLLRDKGHSGRADAIVCNPLIRMFFWLYSTYYLYSDSSTDWMYFLYSSKAENWSSLTRFNAKLGPRLSPF